MRVGSLRPTRSHLRPGGVEAPILASALACQEADLDKHGVLTCRGDLEDECVRGLGVTRHTRR